MIPYEPAHYYQGDGSTYQWSNCVLATCTMAMDRDTVGWWRVPAWQLRDITGGTAGVSYSAAAAAVVKATYSQVGPTVALGQAPGNLRTLAQAGHAGGISISCAVTVSTPFHTGSYTGGHTIYWGAYRSYNGQDQIAILDPGISNAAVVWWPLSLVLAAAEARTGNGTINLLVFRDTEGVQRSPRYAAPIYASPSLAANVLGHLILTSGYGIVLTENGPSWTVSAAGRTVTAAGWQQIRYGTGTGFVTGGSLK